MKKMITLNLFNKSRLEKEFKEIKAIYQNESFLFKIDNIKTLVSPQKFTRENDEYKFSLDILNKKATYLLKQQNYMFDIDVEKIIYKKENNSIILEYKISSADEIIKIELIVEGEINE